MDEILLSRIQFGLTIAFHYIFPPLSIGLGVILVIMESIWLKTRSPLYREMTKFWVRIFALIFAIGVASGIVMEFQFGTNWSAYSRYVGDVFGSALAAEGIFAFFLESGFLAILVFGWDRVSPRFHFFSTLMVALGSTFSAVWIIVANSWMQTPAGHHIVTLADGTTRAEVLDFWKVVFNPSTIDRLSHTLMGAWQAAAWMVIGVCAYYLLKKRHIEFSKAGIKISLAVAIVAAVLQLGTGHSHAITVAKHQPAKMAAYEGHYNTGPGTLYLFGWYVPPDPANPESEGRVLGVGIPKMLSILISGDPNKEVPGLKEFGDDIPPVNTVFQTYHAMVGIGMVLIGLSFLGVYLWWRGKLWDTRWFLMACVPTALLPQLANQLGWFSAEIGRQPWIVQGLMRTSDAVSPIVKANQVLASIIMFSVIYTLLLAVFLYLLYTKIQHGPDDGTTQTAAH